MENNRALTTQEVAYILNIAKNTVYELVKRGELKSYKVGRKLRYSLTDVESYIAASKNFSSSNTSQQGLSEKVITADSKSNNFVICGQDLMLDILSNYLEKYAHGIRALRSYHGSYDSLIELYRGNVQIASSHLWDGTTGEYNVPYVKSLLPGIPAVIIHLTYRIQGFYVAKGNPKNILTWSDLKNPDITMINREKGAGSRVLLDENLRLLGIYGSQIKGYNRESQSHLTLASSVGRGEADVAIGIEKIANQVNGIDFVPLKKERYDLVIKKEDMERSTVQTLLEIIRSEEFKLEFENIGGYDISEMGKIVAET
ncbi:MAG: substrate-binding domain-containing protein [Velocimicrobium sp.]